MPPTTVGVLQESLVPIHKDREPVGHVPRVILVTVLPAPTSTSVLPPMVDAPRWLDVAIRLVRFPVAIVRRDTLAMVKPVQM